MHTEFIQHDSASLPLVAPKRRRTCHRRLVVNWHLASLDGLGPLTLSFPTLRYTLSRATTDALFYRQAELPFQNLANSRSGVSCFDKVSENRTKTAQNRRLRTEWNSALTQSTPAVVKGHYSHKTK